MMKPGSATLRTVSCKNWLILQKVEKNKLGFMRIDVKNEIRYYFLMKKMLLHKGENT